MSTLVSVAALEPGLFELRLSDPAGQNALGEAMVEALNDALRGLAGDDSAKVVLLTGQRELFCSGASRDMLDAVSSGRVAVADADVLRALAGFPVPIVGAIEGSAIGGGLVLAAACDVTVAALEARYGANFMDLGFTPGMGATSLLPALVGRSFGAELLYAAKLYRGRELVGRGLFTHLVPRDEVRPLALDLARRIADKERRSLVLLKAELAKHRLAELEAALAREHAMHAECFAAPGVLARIRERFGG